MSISTLNPAAASKPPVAYPDSDGAPMADNTVQFRWIVTIKGNLDILYAEVVDVFVAGDLLWYPVEGDPTIRQAPDVFVVFGRPKGDRGSYMQWVEAGVAPQVVFEILSPGNRPNQLIRKFAFYEKYGVEEYYIYDPDAGELLGYLRRDGRLEEIPAMQGWVSPRLNCKFEVVDGELVMTRPEGRKFVEPAQRVREVERENDEIRREKEKTAKAVERLREQLRKLGAEPEA
ncbi:MAG: Uma2 family endonuclease [Gemmataceae bacterium]